MSPGTESHQAADPEGTLQAAQRARTSAELATRPPRWMTAVAGALVAGGLAALTGPWRTLPVMLVGLLCAAGLVALHVRWAARGRARGRVGGSGRRRVGRQLIPPLAYGIAWLSALAGGWAVGAVVSACVAGIAHAWAWNDAAGVGGDSW